MVQRQYGAIPSAVREQLASLERIVKTLLQEAVKVGKTFIITNASEGWVQHSASLCMPGLADDLAQVSGMRASGGRRADPPPQPCRCVAVPIAIVLSGVSGARCFRDGRRGWCRRVSSRVLTGACARGRGFRWTSYPPAAHSRRPFLGTAMHGRCTHFCRCVCAYPPPLPIPPFFRGRVRPAQRAHGSEPPRVPM